MPRARGIVVIALIASGCGFSPDASDSPTEVTYELPTVSAPPEFGGCVGEDYGVKLVLSGSPDAAPHAFAERPDGRRLPIRWPQAYGARFSRGLEIVDMNGTVVARAGDEITSPTLAWPGLFVCIGPNDVDVFRQSDTLTPRPP
jgi:hypothetical protein